MWPTNKRHGNSDTPQTMNTTTITTSQIAERLTKSFNDVKALSAFTPSILDTATHVHTVTCFNFLCLELMVGVYTIDSNEAISADTADFKRFVYLSGQNMAFYF